MPLVPVTGSTLADLVRRLLTPDTSALTPIRDHLLGGGRPRDAEDLDRLVGVLVADSHVRLERGRVVVAELTTQRLGKEALKGFACGVVALFLHDLYTRDSIEATLTESFPPPGESGRW